MSKTTESTYPGGSKRRVTRAGEAVRNGRATADDLAVIDIWREAHRSVLNTFQAILRNRTRGRGVVVAQRHKRKRTIFDKLHRLPGMELARMDDIAGCRLIFGSIAELEAFRTKIHKARFNHKMRNKPTKYDYITNPKGTGYRGIHDVYEYDVNSDHGKDYKGLFVEIQYRTLVQHAWATAVELIGLITLSEPKFQRGDDRYEKLMALASEILARAHEKRDSCYPKLTDDQLVREFIDLDEEVGLLKMLSSVEASESDEDDAKGNIILMLSDSDKLDMEMYRDATEALRALFRHEEEKPGADVVLVRGASPGDVRTAFRNYFADATEFIRLLEDGCQKLSGHEALEYKDVFMDAEEFVKDELDEEDG